MDSRNHEINESSTIRLLKAICKGQWIQWIPGRLFDSWKMGAKVVGVPSGQAPNTFMEITPFKLPNTRLECSASNSLQSCFPKDHPMAKTLTPDIQLSYDDYRKTDFSNDAELLFIIQDHYCPVKVETYE